MSTEEAKQAWKKKAYEQNELAGRHLYYLGMEAFKSALREEIEKEIKFDHHDLRGENDGLKKALQLLDSVTPKK